MPALDSRPCHHVNVRVFALVMESSVPTEILWRDTHGCGNLITVGAQQVSPRFSVIVSQPFRVLTPQTDDVRPDIAGVLIQLLNSCGHIHAILVTEQTMRVWPPSHVCRVTASLLLQHFHAVAGADIL